MQAVLHTIPWAHPTHDPKEGKKSHEGILWLAPTNLVLVCCVTFDGTCDYISIN